jgi:hypothetical protein
MAFFLFGQALNGIFLFGHVMSKWHFSVRSSLKAFFCSVIYVRSSLVLLVFLEETKNLKVKSRFSAKLLIASVLVVLSAPIGKNKNLGIFIWIS